MLLLILTVKGGMTVNLCFRPFSREKEVGADGKHCAVPVGGNWPVVHDALTVDFHLGFRAHFSRKADVF